ncbi:MAG: hypothetical protein WA005_06445 [Candidatus Binataceae bacterium]
MGAAVLSFIGTGAVVVAAGIMLGTAADRIAALTGLGRIWTGAVLLAVATSLPELVTDVSAVRIGAANLAAGDLFGSNLTNMLILALLGLLPARKRIVEDASNAITGCLAILLNALAVAALMVRPQLTLAGLQLHSVVLPVVYLFGMRVVYLQGATVSQPSGVTVGARFAILGEAAKPLARSILIFTLGAIMIFFAAPVMASAAQRVALVSGLGSSFVGTWVLGMTTALPELVTSLTAAAIGATDLGVANLFGSCAFNMVIFFVMDLASPKGSVFSVLEPVHVLSGSLSMVLITLGLASVVYRRNGRLAIIEPGSILMMAGYALSIGLVFAYTR